MLSNRVNDGWSRQDPPPPLPHLHTLLNTMNCLDALEYWHSCTQMQDGRHGCIYTCGCLFVPHTGNCLILSIQMAAFTRTLHKRMPFSLKMYTIECMWCQYRSIHITFGNIKALTLIFKLQIKTRLTIYAINISSQIETLLCIKNKVF